MRIVLVALCAAAPGLALAQAPKEGAKAGTKGPAAAMPVRAAPARLGPAVDEVSAVGTLRADEAVSVRPEIAGRIAEIRFSEGQSVPRGALLATLDATEVKAQLEAARAQAKLDAQRLERAEDLHRKSFISAQALDEARSNAARSAALVREIEARLAKTEMRAPFAGVIGLRQVSEGAVVVAGTEIARLEKIDQLKLDFRVPEAYVARLRPGQPVRLAVDAWPGQAFGGTVYALEPAVDEGTRTALVRARVANPERKLRPGMFARVTLELGTRERAIWIPESAVVPRGQEAFVYRVADGRADWVRVQLGLRRPGEVEVLAGLAPGDLVVTEGTLRIFPGAAVTLLPEKPAAAAPERKG
jgi:membrane fusion protein (multidrug efflux system)